MWNRFNVKNFHYGVIKKNTDGTITREKPVAIPGMEKVAVNYKIATGQLYGDGALVEDASKLAGAEIALDLNKLPTKDEIVILGKTKDDNGIVHDNKSDQAVGICIGWEVELTGGESEFIWFTNCIAKPNNKEYQQSTDNITFSKDTLLVTAMPDENGDVRLFGETLDTTFKCAETWFETCPPVQKA